MPRSEPVPEVTDAKAPPAHIERRLRVLLVGPFPPTRGGTTTFLLNLLASPLGERVAFLPFTTSRPPKEAVADNWGYGTLLHGGVRRSLGAVGMTLWHLLTFPLAVIGREADLVHVNASDYLVFWESLAYCLMAQILGRRVVMRLGGSFNLFYERSSPRMQRLIRWALQRPERLVVQSHSWQAYVARLGRGDGVVVLPNFVDPALLRDVPPPAQRDGIPTCLFLVGNESTLKGFHVFCEAVPRVRADACYRLLALPPQLAPKLSRTMGERPYEHSGYLDHDEVVAAMRQADIFLLPSLAEGFPNSLLEAMACSLPVVVSAVGAIPEVVEEGRGGEVVEAGDAAALAAAIDRLAADPALRWRMGQANRERVRERFTPEAALAALETAYRELCPELGSALTGAPSPNGRS